MPTTFNVISLGIYADMDTSEGNNIAENASSLVGTTFGGIGTELLHDFVSFSPGSGGFAGGAESFYDQDNSPAENFRIDGGPDQVFDSAARFTATLTYTDGTTASVNVAIFQDTAGNTYLAPETSQNATQDALEAAPIRSLRLDSLTANSTTGLVADRDSFEFVTCFTPGVRITTPSGLVNVEQLLPGDLVTTRDNGAQPIRWIDRNAYDAIGRMVPIRILAGALGQGLPQRDIMVSQQHRMLVNSRIAERILGSREVLLSAKRLLDLPGVDLMAGLRKVTYLHLLLDRHEIIFAEGAPTESLMSGPMTLRAIGHQRVAEIEARFPGIMKLTTSPARIIPEPKIVKQLVARHLKNAQPMHQP